VVAAYDDPVNAYRRRPAAGGAELIGTVVICPPDQPCAVFADKLHLGSSERLSLERHYAGDVDLPVGTGRCPAIAHQTKFVTVRLRLVDSEDLVFDRFRLSIELSDSFVHARHA